MKPLERSRSKKDERERVNRTDGSRHSQPFCLRFCNSFACMLATLTVSARRLTSLVNVKRVFSRFLLPLLPVI